MEPNPAGIRDIEALFDEHHINKSQYNIYHCRIEKYETKKKYDVVIAEGFLPYVINQREIIKKIQALTAEEGIIVITCSDDVCIFIELMKRLVGHFLVRGISDYQKKVNRLTEIFDCSFNYLKGMSRSASDWIQDQLLNPALINNMELSLAQAIDLFGDEYEMLGSSPRMFTDYSWYKDIWFDSMKNNVEQFEKKRLSLLMAGMPEKILPVNDVLKMVVYFQDIKKLEMEYEATGNEECIKKILQNLGNIKKNKIFDDELRIVFQEIEDMLYRLVQNGSANFAEYPHFFTSFGRTQQYIAFERK